MLRLEPIPGGEAVIVAAADNLRHVRMELEHDDHGATITAAADMLEAIDALLVAYSAGPPEMAPLLNDLYLILHPKEGL